MIENENENFKSDMEELQDKNLQCVRVEINSHVTVFLYYKKYPKSDSKKYPQDRSAIVFFFDHEKVDEKFLWTYLSLIGQIDDLEIGSYINRKGCKKKRRVVNFAIVKFLEEDSLVSFLDRYQTQMKINNFLENKKNRNINLDYDPLKDNFEDEFEEEEVDEEGFVTVSKDVTKKRFSKNGLSFKVSKRRGDEQEENFDEEKEGDEDGNTDFMSRNKKKKQKNKEKGDFYWNHQLLDRKRQSKKNNNKIYFIFIILFLFFSV